MTTATKSALTEYEEKLRQCIIIHRLPLIHIETSDYESEDLRLGEIFSKDELPYNKYNNIIGWTTSLKGYNYHEWCYALKKNRTFERTHIFPIDESKKDDSVFSNLLDTIKGVYEKDNEPTILIIKGIHRYFSSQDDNRDVLSILSSLLYLCYVTNKNKPQEIRSQIVIISPQFDIPPELQGCLFRITPPYPDEEDIERELGLFGCSWKDIQNKPVRSSYSRKCIKYTYNSFFWTGETIEDNVETFNNNKKRLISIFKGMSIRDIVTTLSYNNFIIASVDLDTYRENKERLVRDSGLLNVENVENGYEKYVGDIESLMAYIEERKTIIDNRSFYNPKMALPKGILLIGPPGCGKSETTKAIASKLQMPLLSLDMGKLLSKWSGESEHNFDNAIKIAEAAQPCVLRIDEIEKAFAGAGESEGDQSMTRIIGHFLTWMQERKSMVYIVATANNLDMMRPEFLRKGRWDEIFYLSYPTPTGAMKIIDSCLEKYGFELSSSDRKKLQEYLFKLYSDNPQIKLSGAELSDIIVQSYQQSFIKNPENEVENGIIDGNNLMRQIGMVIKKNCKIEEERKIKDELLSLEMDWELRRSTQITNSQEQEIRKMLKNVFKEDEINRQIQQIKLNTILGNRLFDDTKKSNIKKLLEKKYTPMSSAEIEQKYISKGYVPASKTT